MIVPAVVDPLRLQGGVRGVTRRGFPCLLGDPLYQRTIPRKGESAPQSDERDRAEPLYGSNAQSKNRRTRQKGPSLLVPPRPQTP